MVRWCRPCSICELPKKIWAPQDLTRCRLCRYGESKGIGEDLLVSRNDDTLITQVRLPPACTVGIGHRGTKIMRTCVSESYYLTASRKKVDALPNMASH